MDEFRARYLRERVLTATPAQRIVMLYDRMLLDLERARVCEPTAFPGHVGHAVEVLAELLGSLDHAAGGPADNLASIYGFLIGEFMLMQANGQADRLEMLIPMISKLRDAWLEASERLATSDPVAGVAGGTLTRTA